MKIYSPQALIIIDVQNDFCPGGALAVPGGAEIVHEINRMQNSFDLVVLTQDWHPANHLSFASNHDGFAPFTTITLPYGEQILWPDHCVQDSEGARFHDDLDTSRASLILRKGSDRNIDSYSAFYENDHKTPTGLEGYLRNRKISRLTFVGLATDFCVRYSAVDAAKSGFDVAVKMSACRAIDLDGSLDAALREMSNHDIQLLD